MKRSSIQAVGVKVLKDDGLKEIAKDKKFLKKLSILLTQQERRAALILFFLMLTGAGLETIGIGLLMPFIGLAANPEVINKYQILKNVYSAVHATSYEQFIAYCGFGIILFYILKNIFLGFLNYTQTRFGFDIDMRMSKTLLQTYLYQTYNFHLQKNSADLLNTISNVGRVTEGVVIPLMAIATECMVLGLVTIMLIVARPLPTLIAAAVLGGTTTAFYYFIRKKLTSLGKVRNYHSAQALKWMNQGIGGIKEVKVLGREKFFLDAFLENRAVYVGTSSYTQLVALMPKLFLETLAVLGIISVVCFMLLRGGGDIRSTILTLGLFAVAAARLMPSMNRIVSNLSVMRYSVPALDSIYSELTGLDLNQAISAAQKTMVRELNKHIEVKSLSFSYPGTAKPALDQVSLVIPKGQAIAIIGPSGSGKTTLVDIILGLLKPSVGSILLDSADIRDNISGWQRRIGYIPQTIYLSDDSIRRNIAFGVPEDEIDNIKVHNALRAAQLDEFVSGLREKLETHVGERGVRLSGGQRQRIGIARALYHDPDVLILDEATSALDQETEREVTRAIESLSGKKTMIIIAHRLATAKKCDYVYKIAAGRVVAAGSFEEVCGSANL